MARIPCIMTLMGSTIPVTEERQMIIDTRNSDLAAELKAKGFDLGWEDDPENAPGVVAEVGSTLLALSYSEKISAAGYATSTSRDEDGRDYIWVMHA